METHTDTPTTIAQRLTRGFLALVFLLVLYVLSIGPAFGFFGAKYISYVLTPSGDIERRIYGPLFYFYAPVTQTARATGFLPAVNAYCRWWRDFASRCFGED